MPDEESTEHQFVQQVLSQFNPLESQMGEEAYKANCANMYAHAELMQAQAAVRRSWAALLTIFVIASVGFAIPLMVFLWKWVAAW